MSSYFFRQNIPVTIVMPINGMNAITPRNNCGARRPRRTIHGRKLWLRFHCAVWLTVVEVFMNSVCHLIIHALWFPSNLMEFSLLKTVQKLDIISYICTVFFSAFRLVFIRVGKGFIKNQKKIKLYIFAIRLLSCEIGRLSMTLVQHFLNAE